MGCALDIWTGDLCKDIKAPSGSDIGIIFLAHVHPLMGPHKLPCLAFHYGL
jgi:hypothetical protein